MNRFFLSFNLSIHNGKTKRWKEKINALNKQQDHFIFVIVQNCCNNNDLCLIMAILLHNYKLPFLF